MKKAFTLIEFLVYMALLGMFLLVLTNILATSLETLTESSQTTMVDADGRYLLTKLAYDVARASTMTVTNNSLILDVGTYTVLNNNLLLGSERLNSFDSEIKNFAATQIGKTVKVSFDLTNGNETKSLFTTLGLR